MIACSMFVDLKNQGKTLTASEWHTRVRSIISNGRDYWQKYEGQSLRCHANCVASCFVLSSSAVVFSYRLGTAET